MQTLSRKQLLWILDVVVKHFLLGFQIPCLDKKMQRNCEKINHRWFHYDKFVNRVGKMSDLQGIFIILTPRITAGHVIAP